MDESAKMKLYEQLLEMVELNQKIDAKPIISEKDFMDLPDGLALYYIFEYRDTQTYFEQDDKEVVPYIELPSMDLSNQNLEFLYLSKFVLGTFDENGKIQPSTINLKNTNAMININDLGFNGNRINEFNITEHLLDFSYINFQGCNVFGRLPDEFEEDNKKKLFSKVIISDKEHAFDDIYLRRRKELQERGIEHKKLLDRVYEKIKSGKSLSGTSGIRKVTDKYNRVDLSDYDLTDFDDNDVSNYEQEEYDLYLGKETGFNLKKIKLQRLWSFIRKASLNKEVPIEYIKEIIKMQKIFSEDINAKGFDGNTALYYALETEDFENIKLIVELLIDEKADVNVKTDNNEFVLYRALKIKESKSKKAIVQILIKAGADVNVKDRSDKSVLHSALEIEDIESRREIVELLIKAGADVNAKGDFGESVLYRALEVKDIESRKEIVELLIKAGADVNADEYSYKAVLLKALYIEDTESKKEIIQMLIEAGVNLKGKSILNDVLYIEDMEDRKEIVEFLIKVGADVNVKGAWDESVLHRALEIEDIESRKEILELLIKEGSDINAKDNCDRSVLYKSLKIKDIESSKEIVELLIKAGADVNAKESSGKSVLHRALEIEDIESRREIVELLIKKGADVNAKESSGESVLYRALEIEDIESRKEILELLIKAGADVNAKDNCDRSVLYRALEIEDIESRKEILELLIKAGADVNAKDNCDRSVLYIALKIKDIESRKEILELLIKAGADVNVKDYSSETVLHKALEIKDLESRKEILELLIKAGADVNAKDNCDRSVLDSSLKIKDIERRKQIIKLLIKAGANTFEIDADINVLFEVKNMLIELGKIDESTIVQEKIDSKIKKDIEVEKKTVVNQGKRQVNAAGSFLNSVINDPDIELDYILRMIELGANPNFISYNNYWNSPEYIPTVYKAMLIPDSNRRKAILLALVKAGADFSAKYTKIEYGEIRTEKTVINCLDLDVPEAKIIREKFYTRNSSDLVQNFLKINVKLTEEEIENLTKTFQDYNRNLSDESIEDLDMKKDILAACGSVKAGFTKYGTILFNPTQVLYARLMFFQEQGIKIEQHRLHETMAASKKRFAEKYATTLGLSSDNPEEVKWAILKKYPMPTDKKEFKRKIEDLIQGKDAI